MPGKENTYDRYRQDAKGMCKKIDHNFSFADTFLPPASSCNLLLINKLPSKNFFLLISAEN